MEKKLKLFSVVFMSLILMSSFISANGTIRDETGAVSITNITFDGQNTIAVSSSDSVDVEVTVYTTATSPEVENDWSSTQYMIERSAPVCVNIPEPNENSAGTYSHTFVITAPSAAGTYDFGVAVYSEDNCKNFAAGKLIPDAIAVETDEQSPAITNVRSIPENPSCSASVQVCADITDPSGLVNVEINWENGIDTGSFGLTNTEGNTYCRSLSAVTLDAEDAMEVDYYISAEDLHGNNVQTEGDSFTFDCAEPVVEFYCNPLFGDEDLTISCYSTSTDTVTPLNELEYSWTFGNGLASSAKNPFVVYSEDGLYTVSLTVTDNAGNSGMQTKNDYVNVLDIGPTASFDEDLHELAEGNEIKFTDTSVSHDPISSWFWTFGDGKNSTGQNPTHTYADNGDYNVTLTVCDEDNDCDTALATKMVANSPPNVNAGEYVCDENETVTLTATATDLEIDYPLVFEWDLNGDKVYNDSLGESVSYTCGNGYAHLEDIVSVRVTDKDGSWNVDDAEITINNVLSVADANGPYETAVDDSLCFIANATDDFDSEFTYRWDTDYNGTFEQSLTGQTPCTTYSESGVYTLALIANDGNDSEAVTTTVTVYDYGIELYEGWNLISIPLVPENDDTSIDVVFGSVYDSIGYVDDNTASVLHYDATEDKWYKARKDSNSSGFTWGSTDSELENIVPGFGYWVYMAENATLYLNGEKTYSWAEPPSVTLAMDSWNLIGVYGTNDPTVDQALVSLTDEEGHAYYDIIYDEHGNNDLASLLSTEGYWVSLKKVFAGDETIKYKANYASQN